MAGGTARVPVGFRADRNYTHSGMGHLILGGPKYGRAQEFSQRSRPEMGAGRADARQPGNAGEREKTRRREPGGSPRDRCRGVMVRVIVRTLIS